MFSKFQKLPQRSEFDKLHIHKSKGKITGDLTIIQFIDTDTQLTIAYTPTLDLSGYGSDYNEAITLLKFNIAEYFKYLAKLSNADLQAELRIKGWKKDAIKNKDFSKAFVDVEGKLFGFNIAEGSIKKKKLEIAA